MALFKLGSVVATPKDKEPTSPINIFAGDVFHQRTQGVEYDDFKRSRLG